MSDGMSPGPQAGRRWPVERDGFRFILPTMAVSALLFIFRLPGSATLMGVPSSLAFRRALSTRRIRERAMSTWSCWAEIGRAHV
jgi:hypothetical protein